MRVRITVNIAGSLVPGHTIYRTYVSNDRCQGMCKRDQSCLSSERIVPPVFINSHAFTLLELLAAVTILAILASLTMAAVHGAKKRATNANCISNVRQLAVALQTFVTTTGQYPLDFNPGRIFPEHGVSWEGSLFSNDEQLALMDRKTPGGSYKGVLRCPAQRQPADWVPVPGRGVYMYYGYNQDGLIGPQPGNSLGLGKHIEPSGAVRPVSENEVVKPVEMVAIGDGFRGWGGRIDDGTQMLGRDARMLSLVSFGGDRRARARHQETATIAFCDGHVARVKLDFLFKDTADEALRVWNRDNQPHRDRLTP